MLETIQQNQYVHPITNPPNGPKYSFAISTNELNFVLLSNNSPSPRIKANKNIPMMIYAMKILGPVSLIVWPEPKKSPVPIAPPMAIN